MDKLSTVLKETLILRILIAVGLIVMSLLPLFSDFLVMLMLSFSIVISGFSILLNFIKKVQNKDYFNSDIIVSIAIILLFIAEYKLESAIIPIIYQLGIFFLERLSDHIRTNNLKLINKNSIDILSGLYDSFDGENADVLLMETQMNKTAQPTLILMILISILYAVLMPFINHLTVNASIHRAVSILIIATPISLIMSYQSIGAVALCYAASNGILFKKVSKLEQICDSKIVILDDELKNTTISRELIYAHSSNMDNDTFLNFIYHIIYYSTQPFAEAIKTSVHFSYQTGLILGALDIPDYGIKASINGMQLILGNEQLCTKFNIDVSSELNNDIRGEQYFLCIENKCVGSIIISDESNIDYNDIVVSFSEFGMKCVFTDEDLVRNTSKRVKTSIFYYKNLNKCESDINIVIGESPEKCDACVYPEFINNISMLPYISKRVNDIAKHNSFFAFGFKILIVILSILGFCNPWMALVLDLSVTAITIFISTRLSNTGFKVFFNLHNN